MVTISRIKLVRVHLDTFNRLTAIGKKGDSYEDIVKKVLDVYDQADTE